MDPLAEKVDEYLTVLFVIGENPFFALMSSVASCFKYLYSFSFDRDEDMDGEWEAPMISE